MASSRFVSWQLLLVLAIWLCALVVNCWNEDSVLAGTTPLLSIEGALPLNSLFRRNFPSRASGSHGPSPSRQESAQMLAPAISAEDRHILAQQNELLSAPQTTSKSLLGLSGVISSVKQSQPSFLRSIRHTSVASSTDTLVRNPGRTLNRLMSTEWMTRNSSRPHLQSLFPHLSSSSASYFPTTAGHFVPSKARVRAADDNKNTQSLPSDDYNNDRHAPNEIKPRCRNTLLDVFSSPHTLPRGNDSSVIGKPTGGLSTSHSQDPTMMSGFSSGKSAAQGSCFGLVVGMIVAIMWL